MYRVLILCLTLYFVQGTTQENSTNSHYVSDLKHAVEYEVTNYTAVSCFIHGDGEYIQQIVEDPSISVLIISSEEMKIHIDDCEALNEQLSDGMHQKNIARKKQFVVYPGTTQESSNNSRYFSDLKHAVELEVTNNTVSCFIHGDGEYIKQIVEDPSISVLIISSEEMKMHIDDCEALNKLLPNGIHQKNIARKKRFVVYPGTKWCGNGNTATDYDDLGQQVETDKCCRAHDNCAAPSIAPLSSQYGLTNFALWYKGHCSCDGAFYTCLKNVQGEETADSVGSVFFNVLKVDCIQETGKTVRTCAKRRWWGACYQYKTEVEMEYIAATPY